ncbi:MAG: DNA double-strand break repair nuclease NurA [Nitrososphaerales archaeon]
MSQERTIPDWMKIPVVLQHQFFKHAQEEAERCKRRLNERFKRIKLLAKHIETKPIPKSDEWKNWRVAVVDGSNSPVTSERLGSRYGVYCAGYMIFEGDQPVEEGFGSDEFVQDQVGSRDVAEKVLSMMRVGLERRIALQCLEEKGADLVLLDGSFFGFRAEAYRINDEILDVKGYKRGIDLTSDVRDKTLKLLKSGRAVGIIKRSRTSAFDGWLISRYGDEGHCIYSNDRFILSFLLPVGYWFAYHWLLGAQDETLELKEGLGKDFEKLRRKELNLISFNYYNTFRSIYRYKVLKMKQKISLDKIYDDAAQSLKRTIYKSLKIDHGQVLRTARYHVRCSNALPFELETPLNKEVEPLLSYFLGFHNPATGLPWPIDLVDENVSLPRGFTREFVEEIEAELIRDPEVQDKIGLQAYFSHINPQKEED